ncbi:MAG: thermonuclease family protein [Blastocatellia bacterium]|nr:thermonuclease family protein [Blastocatellia bacterium]
MQRASEGAKEIRRRVRSSGGALIAKSRVFRVWMVATAVVTTVAISVPTSAVSVETRRPAPVVGQTWTGRVVVVADGDTIEVMRDGRAVRVRLAGIDAPEAGQPWSSRARSRLAELTYHRAVTILVRDVDRYGRSVVDATCADGRRVSAVLVAEGLAWFYAAYSTDSELKRLEAEARAARRGLWSDRNPTPPWLWRQRHPRRAR